MWCCTAARRTAERLVDAGRLWPFSALTCSELPAEHHQQTWLRTKQKYSFNDENLQIFVLGGFIRLLLFFLTVSLCDDSYQDSNVRDPNMAVTRRPVSANDDPIRFFRQLYGRHVSPHHWEIRTTHQRCDLWPPRAACPHGYLRFLQRGDERAVSETGWR